MKFIFLGVIHWFSVKFGVLYLRKWGMPSAKIRLIQFNGSNFFHRTIHLSLSLGVPFYIISGKLDLSTLWHQDSFLDCAWRGLTGVIMWILLGFYLNIGKYQLAHFYLSPLILPVYRVIYIQFIVICDCQYALTEYIFPQNRFAI